MSRQQSQYANPCKAAADASYRCLDEHNYDKGKCQALFDAYKECKQKVYDMKMQERNKNFGNRMGGPQKEGDQPPAASQ